MSQVLAVIYCRVSSEKQVQQGSGLHSQETRCRSFAKEKGFKVINVFHDGAISGALEHRPAITELLKYISDNKNKGIRIIIDDVSRLARDIKVYLTLKALFIKYNAVIVSPNHNFFEDNPENKLMETITVGMAEFERNKNTQRVISRMKARLEDGFWPFPGFPRCFKFQNVKGMGKLLIPNDLAGIYKEVLEGYAYDRFHTLSDAHKYLVTQEVKIEYSKFCEMVQNPLIAGYIEYPEWEISWRKAQHEGVISLEVFERIQSKRSQKGPKQVQVKDELKEDFPLRGFVKCVETESKFTGAWSTNGSGNKKPYYQARVTRDQREEKGFRSRSFLRDMVHEQLEELLMGIKPKQELVKLTQAVLEDVWNTRTSEAEKRSKKDLKRVKDVEEEIQSILDRVTKTKSERVIKIYENKLEDLEKEKSILEQGKGSNQWTSENFQTALELVLSFVQNPYIYWKNGNSDTKKTVLKLCFQGYLWYSQKSGFQTPNYSLPFKLFRQLEEGESLLVDISQNCSNEFIKWVFDWEKVIEGLINKENKIREKAF